MDEITKEALEGSITKWKNIVESPKALDKGTMNCPLCREFLSPSCMKCPVKEASGRNACQGTPYESWAVHMTRHGSEGYFFGDAHHRVPHCRTCLRLARKEVAFLESLRDKS